MNNETTENTATAADTLDFGADMRPEPANTAQESAPVQQDPPSATPEPLQDEFETAIPDKGDADDDMPPSDTLPEKETPEDKEDGEPEEADPVGPAEEEDENEDNFDEPEPAEPDAPLHIVVTPQERLVRMSKAVVKAAKAINSDMGHDRHAAPSDAVVQNAMSMIPAPFEAESLRDEFAKGTREWLAAYEFLHVIRFIRKCVRKGYWHRVRRVRPYYIA